MCPIYVSPLSASLIPLSCPSLHIYIYASMLPYISLSLHLFIFSLSIATLSSLHLFIARYLHPASQHSFISLSLHLSIPASLCPYICHPFIFPSLHFCISPFLHLHIHASLYPCMSSSLDPRTLQYLNSNPAVPPLMFLSMYLCM